MCYTFWRSMMNLHQQFLAFTERALRSDTSEDENAPDLHTILATLAEGGDVYELMRRVPEEKVAEVLTWVMNVDMASGAEF